MSESIGFFDSPIHNRTIHRMFVKTWKLVVERTVLDGHAYDTSQALKANDVVLDTNKRSNIVTIDNFFTFIARLLIYSQISETKVML